MTQNQIAYHKQQEEARAHRVDEAERKRHNLREEELEVRKQNIDQEQSDRSIQGRLTGDIIKGGATIVKGLLG